jgi:DNA-directed RNA polymerase specialized sigma24 family protein
MARILDLLLNKKSNKACANYPTHEAFYNGLLAEEDLAIKCLYAKTAGSIHKMGKTYRLNLDEIEELIGDCIAICLQKIKSQVYEFKGHSPATYTIEIAKYRVQNIRRQAIKHQTIGLELLDNQADIEFFSSEEEVAKLEKLLLQLDDNCQNLIRLKYLDQCRDKEVIEQKKTQYSTVDALKNNRGRCLKKLIELAKKQTSKL